MLALSFGTPIIAPPLGMMAELLDADLGIRIEPNDPQSLADALLRVGELTGPEIRRRVIEYARQHDVETMSTPLPTRFGGCLRRMLLSRDRPGCLRPPFVTPRRTVGRERRTCGCPWLEA